MKKLDIRFDTEKVNKDLIELSSDKHCRSEVARSAMNIGLESLLVMGDGERSELIEEFK